MNHCRCRNTLPSWWLTKQEGVGKDYGMQKDFTVSCGSCAEVQSHCGDARGATGNAGERHLDSGNEHIVVLQ